MRFDDPIQLKNFPNEQLAKLPLESARTPIDLRRSPSRAWVGYAQLADDRIIEVELTPLSKSH